MADFIFTVSEVNGYVKKVLEAEELLQNIKIRGEVSNYKKSFAGHIYFTLKDEGAAVQCVWFAGASKYAPFEVKDGDKVKVQANVSLYIKGGTYQFIVKSVQKDGTGDLYERFEKLKKELAEQGLFDQEHKKAIPSYPKVVGVITSGTGAAIKDITSVLDDSWCNVTLRLYPVSVQGDKAAPQMREALMYFVENNAADVIIIGRGGGSFEDLNCFNDEALVRDIFDCHIPVISAVGHETDFTLCDFVADVREATPSTAAKCAVPQKQEELEKLRGLNSRLKSTILRSLENATIQVSSYKSEVAEHNPKNVLTQRLQHLDYMHEKLKTQTVNKMDSTIGLLDSFKHTFAALNPNNTLKRGYAVIEDENEKAMSSVNDVIIAKNINIRMHDGKAKAKVLEVQDAK
jgi:exodeoxyribonuclease VII large subunit